MNFLGEFSTAFNQMVQQLSEREAMLKEQSLIMHKNVVKMKSVMDSGNDWIIVTSHEKVDFLYFNKAAEEYFFRGQYIFRL